MNVSGHTIVRGHKQGSDLSTVSKPKWVVLLRMEFKLKKVSGELG